MLVVFFPAPCHVHVDPVQLLNVNKSACVRCGTCGFELGLSVLLLLYGKNIEIYIVYRHSAK